MAQVAPGHAAAWSPLETPTTEGNSREAECASKDILVLVSQVTAIN